MILKCKMCGGDIEVSPNRTFGPCEHCGSTMTFPRVSGEQQLGRFNRGNQLRLEGAFDEAQAVYAQILQEDETNAEAHWCRALCRFGIQYEEDPATFQYDPVCRRSGLGSFLQDADYLAALQCSEGVVRRKYQKEAARIAQAQGIVPEASAKTVPEAPPAIVPKASPNKIAVVSSPPAAVDAASLLSQVFDALQAGKWDKADGLCDQILSQDPQNGRAYLGKLMAELRVATPEELQDCPRSFANSRNYQKAIRCGDESLSSLLTEALDSIKERSEQAKRAERNKKRWRIALIVLGVLNGGLRDVFVKAANLCTECIGLG